MFSFDLRLCVGSRVGFRVGGLLDIIQDSLASPVETFNGQRRSLIFRWSDGGSVNLHGVLFGEFRVCVEDIPRVFLVLIGHFLIVIIKIGCL
jgi:hypothetical protein